MPMCNHNLKVHAIDFQPWQQHYIGVLSTPWFMNLMLLPGETDDWSELQELSKHSHTFPSGHYEFIIGDDPDIGKYQMCSLFSPMFEFADDETAVETAQIIMKELMNNENKDEEHIQPQQMKRLWHGDSEQPENELPGKSTPETEQQERPLLSERLEQPLSRRQLLRGMFSDDGEKA